MNEAITVGMVLWVGGGFLLLAGVLAIIVGILSAIGKGMSR